MQIQSVEIQNFKSIKNVAKQLNGNNVFLVAPNGMGKTSFIDACFGAMPEQPLRDGAKSGNVKINIGDYIVEFKFSARSHKPKMNIFDANGNAQTKPATLFKELFGVTDFNIDTFINKPVSKQIDFIKEITGIDWSDVDARFKELYDERRFKSRELKELEGEIAGRFFDTEIKPVDVSEVTERLNAAMKNNANIDRINSGVENKMAERASIAEQIRVLNERVFDLDNEISKGETWLKDHQQTPVSSIQKELNEAAEHNASIQENTKVGELRDKAGTVATEVDEIQNEMDEITEAKKRELENTPLPVSGLELDDDKLLLDGLPFNDNQINTARRIIAGLELQFQLMQDVKIARFDGSLLDSKNLKEVEAWAEQRGIQLFVELVDRNGDDLKIEVCEK